MSLTFDLVTSKFKKNLFNRRTRVQYVKSRNHYHKHRAGLKFFKLHIKDIQVTQEIKEFMLT